jgi:hypothetical protein
VLLRHVEQGEAAHYLEGMVGGAFSQFQRTEQEIGLDRLSGAALQCIGSQPSAR